MTAVTFTRHGHLYTVRFNYSPDVVAIIKHTVPHHARTWQPRTKTWTVDAGWAPELAAAFRRAKITVVGLDTQPAASPGWARAVFDRVGATRRAAAYRLLSRLCHPDHGGTHDLQLELNQAYAELNGRN